MNLPAKAIQEHLLRRWAVALARAKALVTRVPPEQQDNILRAFTEGYWMGAEDTATEPCLDGEPKLH